MKRILYRSIKQLIKAALFCYYKKVRIHGLSELPKNKPIMLLANHQNALMDALIMAAYSKKAPYFLTRSDVFTSAVLKAFFKLLRMIPIYRLRDGRESLGRNQEIFDNCSRLLNANQTILLFPEANHNIRRTVRPLSKGFTRILFNTLEKFPELDILLVPVGVNYNDAAGFPDTAAFYFGSPLHLDQLYTSPDLRLASMEVRESVSSAIKLLTTHIAEELPYEEIIAALEDMKVDYLTPEYCNALIKELANRPLVQKAEIRGKRIFHLWDIAFEIFNLPILLVWRLMIKNKIPEVEFRSTYRFLFSCISYPVYFALLLLIMAAITTPLQGLVMVSLVFLFNLSYVKLR